LHAALSRACQGESGIHPFVDCELRLGGESNRSVSNIIRKSKEDYRALKGNGVGGVWALVWKNISKLPQFLKRQD